MSYEDDDDIEDEIRPKRVEDFHSQEQFATPAAKKSVRSAADDVIDLLGGVTKPEKQIPRCAKCGGTNFNVRTPLSGPKVSQCTACGTRSYGAPRSSVWMQGATTSHGQGTGGAYYSGSEVAPPNSERHPAKFRTKSRSYAALTDEENS